MALYNIITDVGSTFVKGTSTIYMRLGDNYLALPGRYLEEGSRVLFEKEYIKVPLVDVDKVLQSRMEAYRSAKDILFEKNNAGVFVPRLRTEILRGIAPDMLEDIVLLNSQNDLTVSDYRACTDLVVNVINQYAEQHSFPSPTWSTVLSWIKGEVVAPQRKEFFEALGSFNAYFTDVFYSFQKKDDEKNDFADAYKYYTITRSGLMAYLAMLRPQDAKGEHDPDKRMDTPRKNTLHDQIAVVLEEFGESLQSQYVDAVVVSIQRVRKKKELAVFKRQESEHGLFKGILQNAVPKEKTVVELSDILKPILSQMDPLETPEAYVIKAKEVGIASGFPLEMIKEHLLGKYVDPSKIDDLLTENGFTYEGMKQLFYDELEKDLGVPYSSLSEEEKRVFDELILGNIPSVSYRLKATFEKYLLKMDNYSQAIEHVLGA